VLLKISRQFQRPADREQGVAALRIVAPRHVFPHGIGGGDPGQEFSELLDVQNAPYVRVGLKNRQTGEERIARFGQIDVAARERCVFLMPSPHPFGQHVLHRIAKGAPAKSAAQEKLRRKR
jgi:hypothetical protein